MIGEQAGVDGRVDGAGSDVVAGDAEGAELDGEVTHEHAQAALGGAVAGEVGEDHILVHGGNIDDAAGFFGVAQPADEGLGEKEGALEIDVEHGVVVLFGDVPEGGALFDAGVVDEDVAAAQLLPGLIDEVLGVGHLGDVGLDEDGLVAGSLDLGFGLVGGLDVVTVVDDAVGALLGAALGDGLTDAGP